MAHALEFLVQLAASLQFAALGLQPLDGRLVSLAFSNQRFTLALQILGFCLSFLRGLSVSLARVCQPDSLLFVRTRHFLVCDLDTMFHKMQGVIGVKLRWVRAARLVDVHVSELTNLGDDWHWVCKQSYKLPENRQVLMPQVAHKNGFSSLQKLSCKRSGSIWIA